MTASVGGALNPIRRGVHSFIGRRSSSCPIGPLSPSTTLPPMSFTSAASSSGRRLRHRDDAPDRAGGLACQRRLERVQDAPRRGRPREITGASGR